MKPSHEDVILSSSETVGITLAPSLQGTQPGASAFSCVIFSFPYCDSVLSLLLSFPTFFLSFCPWNRGPPPPRLLTHRSRDSS